MNQFIGGQDGEHSGAAKPLQPYFYDKKYFILNARTPRIPLRDEDLFAYFGIPEYDDVSSDEDHDEDHNDDNDNHSYTDEDVAANEPNEDLPIGAGINDNDELSEEIDEEDEDHSNGQTPEVLMQQNPLKTPESIRRRVTIKPETVDRNFRAHNRIRNVKLATLNLDNPEGDKATCSHRPRRESRMPVRYGDDSEFIKFYNYRK